MTLAEELHDAMIDAYRQAYEKTGYRGARFFQAVQRNGGLATAKRMLKPRNKAQRTGLDRLLEAGEKSLTMEGVVLQKKFSRLFSTAEKDEARKRLGWFGQESARVRRERERLYPDELEVGRTYAEGAKRQVRVNAHERNPRARRACIAHHGSRCAVCDVDFEERYGKKYGRGFIHVHHLRPLASSGATERVDSQRDLVPVCPNCHAMLHREEPPLSIARLKRCLRNVIR